MTEPRGPRYGTIDADYATTLATTAPGDDGPVWMVNLMKYRDVADYADGRESSISGQEADDLYSPLESLAAVGARPVFFGDVDQQLLGDGTVWDRVGVVKYPTRKSFIDMQAAFMAVVMDPSRLAAQADHREVAIADTYTMIVRAQMNTLDASTAD